jgi:hypothetical protein
VRAMATYGHLYKWHEVDVFSWQLLRTQTMLNITNTVPMHYLQRPTATKSLVILVAARWIKRLVLSD